ncbi:hypothetical protein D9M69_633300 [compost metagenome]
MRPYNSTSSMAKAAARPSATMAKPSAWPSASRMSSRSACSAFRRFKVLRLVEPLVDTTFWPARSVRAFTPALLRTTSRDEDTKWATV